MKARSIVYKLMLIGDAGTGKTSTLIRFADDKFSPGYKATIGADYILIKPIEIGQADVRLQCWDMPGKESFVGLSTTFYRGSDAFLLFYDLTNPQSLENIPTWINVIKSAHAVNLDNCAFMLVGNKADLTDQRQVKIDTVQAMLEKIKSEFELDELPMHMEISAMGASNVDQTFVQVAQKLLIQFPPEDEKPQPQFLAYSPRKSKDNTKTNAAISTAALLTIAIIVLAFVFWPAIVVLPIIQLVLLSILAIAVVAGSAAGASSLSNRCRDPLPEPKLDGSTQTVFADLGISELNVDSSSDIDLDDVPLNQHVRPSAGRPVPDQEGELTSRQLKS